MGGGGVEGGVSVDTVEEIVDNPLNLYVSAYVRTCSAATNVFHPTYQPLKWFFLICSRCRQKVNPAYCEGASCCMTTSITVLPTDNFWSPRNPSVAF